LSRLAAFLASIVSAWDAATPEQGNRLARRLVVEIAGLDAAWAGLYAEELMKIHDLLMSSLFLDARCRVDMTDCC
jgi:hypothetical protein